MSSTPMPRAWDWHCHADLFPDPPKVLAEAAACEIGILTVTTTPKAWARNQEWAARHPLVRVGLGLHPELVGSRHEEIGAFEEILPRKRYVGEVGLDGSPQHRSSFERQRQVFERILARIRERGDKVVTIHSRRAAREVLDLLERYPPRADIAYILHWFTGPLSIARRATDLGCFFSVNTDMLRSEHGARIAKEVPSDRLLTETDGPFGRTRGEPSKPPRVFETIDGLAQLRATNGERMREQLSLNSLALFQ